MKRTELLTKYQPTYPLVVEVDKEITDTRSALTLEETSPVKEETTGQNPTYAWVDGELAKAKSDLAGLEARETALNAIVGVYYVSGAQARGAGNPTGRSDARRRKRTKRTICFITRSGKKRALPMPSTARAF